MNAAQLRRMNEQAGKASEFLKSVGNAHRLRLLCLMMEKERPVSELAESVGLAQSAASQHLARMRQEGLVTARRDGQTVYYRLADRKVPRLISLMQDMFC